MTKFNIAALILGLALFIGFGFDAASQVSQGGTPPSFLNKSVSDDFQVLKLEKPDMDQIVREDKINERENAYRPRVGVSVMVGKGIHNSGTWTTLDNGDKIWRLRIDCEDALALGVYFDNFLLPEGGELYLYNQNKIQVLGAFTSYNNNSSGLFATQMVQGDQVTLEYYQPARLTEMPEINISEVAYTYRNVNFSFTEQDGRSSWWCMININCEEGDDWQTEKKGVVKQYMKVGFGYYLCSGSLVNNTDWDRSPYVLTASHCGYGASTSDLNQWVFYYNYEAMNCNGTSGSQGQSMTGCSLKAWDHLQGPDPGDILGSDFFLVLLNGTIPDAYDPYFNGWDRRDVAATSAVSIHHPNGDIKKISTTFNPVYSSAWVSTPGTHWRLYWSETVNGKSIMQGGSSGSPLFNQDHRIVGDLTGGYVSNSCETPSPAFYGKFSYSWDQCGNNASFRLKDWLDASNKGWLTCDGVSWELSPPVADFEADTTITTMGDTVRYTDISQNYPNQWVWEFEGANITTSYEQNPAVVYVDSGYFDVKLTATNPDGTDEILKEDYIYVNFVDLPVADFTSDTAVLVPWEDVNFFDLSTGNPFEWSWEFEGGNPATSTDQNPTEIKYYSSGLYDVTLTATNGGGSNTTTKEDYINVVWVGIDENNEVQNIKLFPNPTSGTFSLELINLDYQNIEIKVLNASGSLVKSVTADDNTKLIEINIEDQPEGMYYLNITVDDKNFLERVSVVK